MNANWTRLVIALFFLSSCGHQRTIDGNTIELQILADNHLAKDYSNHKILQDVVNAINCADSGILKKKLVLADSFLSQDTSEILVIPFVSEGKRFKSSAYSDVGNRFILINPEYIRSFTEKNTISGDTTSFMPVVELMLLHEVGHFILGKKGSFDQLSDSTVSNLGEQRSNSQPEFLTTIKKTELIADSLAIDIVKQKLNNVSCPCLSLCFDIERVVPGMQFQMSGTRMIQDFGAPAINFLHDPSNDHPNMELRITFMNYFLFPSESRKQMIDDYIYNRTVAPVHRQEFDPQIYRGQEKKLPK